MYNNIANIFRNIFYFFSDILTSAFNLPRLWRNYQAQFRIYITDQQLKFQNIVETNIDLGKYHLRTGYISDAILRFRIAEFFFAKDNPEIHYWLGWCYFIKGNYNKAKDRLQKAGKADEVRLGSFLETIDSSKEIPRQIFEDLREITQCEGNRKYYAKDLYNNNIELPMEYIQFFLSSIESLPYKPKILDYGCGSGIAGSYLDYKIDQEYNITGVDFLDICLDYIKNIRGERGYVYDNAHRAYLDNPDRVFNKNKYDIILSFDSLAFTKDLSKIFASFNNSLNRDGVISVLLPTAKETHWDKARRTYAYSPEDLIEQVRTAKFDIIDIKEWSLGKNKKYVSFVARK